MGFPPGYQPCSTNTTTCCPPATPGLQFPAIAVVGVVGTIGGVYMTSPRLDVVGVGRVPPGYPQPGTFGGGASPNTNTPEGKNGRYTKDK